MKTIIRCAEIADIPALIEIEEACFTTDKLPARQFRYLMEVKSAEVIKSEMDNQITGYAVLLFRRNSNAARLYSIAVAPDFRKQGIAQQLCNYVELLAIKRHCKELKLEVRKSAKSIIQFYIKYGYEPFGEYKKFYEDGEDAIRMKKRIPTTKHEIDKD